LIGAHFQINFTCQSAAAQNRNEAAHAAHAEQQKNIRILWSKNACIFGGNIHICTGVVCRVRVAVATRNASPLFETEITTYIKTIKYTRNENSKQ
jgi:hypothetical protein